MRPDVRRLLCPQSIAIVGASDKSRWSSTIIENLRKHRYPGQIHLVNPKGGIVHGQAAARSLRDLDGPVDLGIVVVPGQAVPGVMADLATVNASSALVLTSGFAEVGEEGARRQAEISSVAEKGGIALVGPNSLGFINLAERVWAWATPVAPPSSTEGVAILSQSGATAFFLAELAHRQDVGLSHVIATGNEAGVDASAFFEHLVDDPNAKAIALFIETVRDPLRFVNAAQRALRVGKPVVVLKVGSSVVTARSAEAHTGALVGDDRVFEGICRQYGLMRVGSIEDLLSTADVAARTGVLRKGGVAIVSNSGGICEIAADRMDEYGVDVPELDAATAASLSELLPGYGTPHNPLDLTGGVEPEACKAIVQVLGSQENYAAVLCPYYAVPTSQDEVSERLTALHKHLGEGLRGLPVPGFLVSYTQTLINDQALAIIRRDGLPYHACGLDRAIKAIGQISRWSDRFRSQSTEQAPAPGKGISPSVRPRSEHEALEFLSSFGAPVVPWRLARSEDEAVEAASLLGGPVVVKIASPDIGHKSDIGGVVLNVVGESAVREAFRSVSKAAADKAPKARVDGALLMPMRRSGLELFVGVLRDPQWGPVLAVGLGGVWVETLKDVSLRLLPVDRGEVRRMLAELRGAALLDGQRGMPAADVDQIASAVVVIGNTALAAGPDLRALDVNPLWVRGQQIEALDALFDWQGGHAQSAEAK